MLGKWSLSFAYCHLENQLASNILEASIPTSVHYITYSSLLGHYHVIFKPSMFILRSSISRITQCLLQSTDFCCCCWFNYSPHLGTSKSSLMTLLMLCIYILSQHPEMHFPIMFYNYLFGYISSTSISEPSYSVRLTFHLCLPFFFFQSILGIKIAPSFVICNPFDGYPRYIERTIIGNILKYLLQSKIMINNFKW